MACDQTPPCGCPEYQSTGCLDTYNTDCVQYTGTAIACLDIATGDTLTQILDSLTTIVCNIVPTAYEDYDYGCLSVLNIETQQDFVENTSDLLCQILGSQIPGGVTSLSSIQSSISTLTSTVTTVNSQTTLDCFETISGLPGPSATATALFVALQQVACDHQDAIDTLTSLGSTTLVANDSATIDFTTSGTGNHTLTGSVKLSSGLANNALTEQVDGIHVLSPVITPVDTATIDLTVSGTHSHTVQAAVKISAVGGNQVIAQVDGIYVPAATLSETPFVANDSTTIDFTTSGTSNHTLTGSVKLDPAVDNIISSTGSGLYANASSFTVGNNSITDLKLRDSIAYSVIGRSAGTTGDPTDVVAGSDGVLRRSGTGDLQFGTLVTGNIGNDQVTLAKIQNIASSSVIGRSSGGSGDPEVLAAGSNMSIAGGVINTYGRTIINVTRFTSDGTWTKPSGCNAVIVEVIGGGGVSGSASNAAAGAGGSGGAYSMNYITSGLAATEAVTVGSGGTGGAAGVNAGASGGDSSFGAHIVVEGGDGGAAMAFGTAIALVAGGAIPGITTTSGTVLATGGGPGGVGMRLSGTVALSGYGGSSKQAVNIQQSGAVSGDGTTSTVRGIGGSGAVSTDGTNYAGGNGSGGLVIVYELS